VNRVGVYRYDPYFAAGLTAAIAMTAAGGGIFDGRAGAAGALTGAFAAAVDIYFLVRFGESWLLSTKGRRRALVSGLLALAAKTFIPAGAIAVACVRGWVEAPAVALGAAALAVVAPMWLAICMLIWGTPGKKVPATKWN
jgi:hypothetical protein